MKSAWSDVEAAAAIEAFAAQGVDEDVALRVYTSWLLGRDWSLVLHGGGNTSVKTTMNDVTGAPTDVLCVKGSGWDLATIEPPGLPAVRLDAIQRLRSLDELSDEDMVNACRGAMLDSSGPTPSVETLFHAFLPHRFVDHTHANAILALTDQPDGDAVCHAVFGDDVIVLPYVMPGFALAKAAADAYDAQPDATAMILGKHGAFTFADTARDAYERMVDLVTRAEEHVAAHATSRATRTDLPNTPPTVAQIAPILRGLAGRADGERHFHLFFRQFAADLEYVNGVEVARYGTAGVVTPDHAIRIKPRAVLLPAPDANDIEAFVDGARAAIDAYVEAYRASFARHDARLPGTRTALDAVPRVMLIPGVGIATLGTNRDAARIASDLAGATVEVVTAAESIGTYEPIDEGETFEMEYWSLEQAKLGRRTPPPLEGRIVVVTGAGGTIGWATAEAFMAAGAEVAALDIDAIAPDDALSMACDVTNRDQVEAAFDRVAEVFGGVDIVVSNAGAAWQGRIGDVDDATLRESFELNFFAHQAVASAAVRRFRAQGMGGVLLFNVSKQAVNPGRDFGPYGLPKAALMALVKQYALDYGDEGIRSCGVNADRIRGGMLTDEMVAARSAARGVDEATYMRGNLLGREVRASDVAEAFLSLATATRTTGAITTVDGGNIAASLR